MASEEYKESEMAKIVKRLMDEEGFEFGEAVREAMEQTKNFESKADGGSIGIEVLFTDKMKNGGRVPMVSGGALKAIGSGIMKMFSKGDDALDLAKQEEIFRSGNITTDFLENVDDKVIEKFIRTRDTKGVGGYGMYDSFAEMPNGLKAAELISRIKTADGGINYEAAELFIGKKLKGDETVDELISMVITEKKADGGRVGLFMGGPALEGQALNIYNSMNAYGFSDQEIANALQGQGLYTPPGSGAEPPTTIQPVGFQGGGGDGRVTELQETFTKDLSQDPRFDYLEPTAQANKYRFDRSVEPRDGLMGLVDKTKNFFAENKFFQPKVRGTLGTRLSNQPRLPLPLSVAAYARSPFNPESPTYNANIADQLNFLELGENLIGRDPGTGGLKYGSGSVLSGKNVISGFGTNNYDTALRNFISKMKANTRISAERKAARLAAAEKELLDLQTKSKKGLGRDVDRGGFDPSGPTQRSIRAEREDRSGRGQSGGFTNPGKGSYGPFMADGGLATMFTRRR